MKMDLIEGSETSAIINQTPGNYPKENRLYYIVICGLCGPTIFFHIISQTARFSWGEGGGKLKNIKRVFWFSLRRLSEILLIHRRNERDISKNVHWSSCKVTIVYVIFYWHLNFLGIFSKNTQISNLMKIRPVEDEFFFMRTDKHDETNSFFSQFLRTRLKSTRYSETQFPKFDRS